MQKELRTWNEIDLLAGMIYGEARGESLDGQILVGITAVNRATHPDHWNWGENLREVLLKPYQFECFEHPQVNKIIQAQKTQTNVWRTLRLLAEGIYLGRFNDYVAVKPTHYHKYTITPSWTKNLKFLFQEGAHLFYTCF